MARKSKWDKAERKKLLKLVKKGVTETDIRQELGIKGQAMSSAEFAQQP